MTRYFLLILLYPFVLPGQNVEDRTVNFPKQTVYVDSLPSVENVWVFIMAGQSQMAGRGIVEPQDTVPHPRILSIDSSNRWIYAKEPLHFYQPKLTGLDCGMSFARELIKNVDSTINIAVLPCAVGGSSIEYWLNDSVFNGVRLKSNFMEKVDFAKMGGILKGILWHQGESDAFPDKIPVYEKKLKENFAFFREYAQNDSLPIFVGQLGAAQAAHKYRVNWGAINQIISKVVEEDKNCYWIETSGFTVKSDSVHFDAPSERILGKRYARSYLNLLESQSGCDVGPDVTECK